MKVTIDGMEINLTKKEVEEFHNDRDCVDDCPVCAREAYTLEDYKAQQADLEHSSGEISLSSSASDERPGKDSRLCEMGGYPPHERR